MKNALNPNVAKGEFALIQVKVRTGIVLDIKGKRYTGTGEHFLFFKTLAAASEKAREIIYANPKIECVIQDDQNTAVLTVRDENL